MVYNYGTDTKDNINRKDESDGPDYRESPHVMQAIVQHGIIQSSKVSCVQKVFFFALSILQ